MGLNEEAARLMTFKNWRNPYVSRDVLAKCGFYYIGPNDLVCCYFCDMELGMLEEGDDIPFEHRKWTKGCPFLDSTTTDNVPLNNPMPKDVRVRKFPTVRLDLQDKTPLCKICYKDQANAIFFPCGHFAACWSCARKSESCPKCWLDVSTLTKVAFE